jgi:hypothetical protein
LNLSAYLSVAYFAGLARCELSEESVFKLMGSHLTIKMMDEVCSVLDETKRILQYTRAQGADRVLRQDDLDFLACIRITRESINGRRRLCRWRNGGG